MSSENKLYGGVYVTSFYDELQPEEWPSYARPEGIEADPRLYRAIFGDPDSLEVVSEHSESDGFTSSLVAHGVPSTVLKVDKFLNETFEATVVDLLNHFRKGLISTDELAYLLQEATTWFDIVLD